MFLFGGGGGAFMGFFYVVIARVGVYNGTGASALSVSLSDLF